MHPLLATTTSLREPVAAEVNPIRRATGQRVATQQLLTQCSWIPPTQTKGGALRTAACASDCAQLAAQLPAKLLVQASASLFKLKIDVGMATNNLDKPSGAVKRCHLGTVFPTPLNVRI